MYDDDLQIDLQVDTLYADSTPKTYQAEKVKINSLSKQ